MSRLDLISHLGLPVEFPEFFPPKLERYRHSIADATDTPDEFGVAYMLAAAATAAGAEVSACVQPGWCVRSNVFMAVIGYKGSGKSTLASKVFAPLLQHEAELRECARDEALECVDDDEDGGDGDDDSGAPRRRNDKTPDPCVIVNDCTGPAVLRLLEHSQRQLLVNPDEMSAMFIRNTGGTDRQLWCELYDGRYRRQHRASSRGQSVALESPYLCMLGGIQPDLLACTYSSRGDDGLLDRMLLVGPPRMPQPAWPRDADDPALNTAWADSIRRLLHIEHEAADAIGGQVESLFTAEARDCCIQFFNRLNAIVALIGLHESQMGIVKKLSQHAVKLALLHRCLRWAACEFGEQGTFGNIDVGDATAACDATLFFLGRWLMWRPELRGSANIPDYTPIGLAHLPGNDPALQSLAVAATGAQTGIRLIERLVRYTRHQGGGPIAVHALAAREPFMEATQEELHNACLWLVQFEHGEWLDEPRGVFRLNNIPESAATKNIRQRPARRRSRTPKARPIEATAGSPSELWGKPLSLPEHLVARDT